MKPSLYSWTSAALTALALALAFTGLGGGCATRSGVSSAPKPGRGIAEYRDVAREARRSVVATVKTLEALAQPPGRKSGPHPALAGFDRAVGQLELDSVKARARAEAIIARGQAYFDEWKGQLAVETNAAVAEAEAKRFERLYEHFARVQKRSGEVREEFRPFMASLREYRARLDPVQAAHGPPPPAELEGLTARGRRVLQTLDAVLSALDAAEAEVKATFAIH